MRDTVEWTDDVLTRMRVLWDEGHSTAEIGRRMSMSKNAVVGKAHRLGWPSRPSPIKHLAPGEERAMPVRRVKANESTLPALVIRAEALPPPVALPVAIPSPRPEVIFMRQPDRPVLPFPRVARPCAWPFGEPGTRAFRFCEEPSVVGRPYCQCHCDIAYVKVPRLQAVAAE